jgi:hypothetical protein
MISKLRTLVLATGVAAFCIAGLSNSAVATTLTFFGNAEFSGGTDPAGPPPWFTAVFDDSVGPDLLSLSITTAGLSGSEKLTEFSFNVDESITISALSPAAGTTAPAGTVNPADLSTIDGTPGAFKADGDGYFDILIDYPTSGDVFGAGEVSKWTLSGIGLTLSSLLSLSTDKNGNPIPGGGLLFAAHIQSIAPGGNSGWVTGDYVIGAVPIPGALPLFLTGLGLLGWLGRRKRPTTARQLQA